MRNTVRRTGLSMLGALTTTIFKISSVLSIWIFIVIAFRGYAEIRQITPNATAAAALTPTSTQDGRNTVKSMPAPNAGKAIAAAFTRFELPLQQILEQRFVSTTPFQWHYMPNLGKSCGIFQNGTFSPTIKARVYPNKPLLLFIFSSCSSATDGAFLSPRIS